MIARLEPFGITLAELERGKAMVDAVTAAYARQKQFTGKAQQSTRERDEALADLKAWMSDFLAIARVALKNNEAHQEAIGILVR